MQGPTNSTHFNTHKELPVQQFQMVWPVASAFVFVLRLGLFAVRSCPGWFCLFVVCWWCPSLNNLTTVLIIAVGTDWVDFFDGFLFLACGSARDISTCQLTFRRVSLLMEQIHARSCCTNCSANLQQVCRRHRHHC